MAQIPPIDDSYIDEIIKAAEAYNPALNKTQGVRLRELIKKLRDRFEQENSYVNELLTGFENALYGKISNQTTLQNSANFHIDGAGKMDGGLTAGTSGAFSVENNGLLRTNNSIYMFGPGPTYVDIAPTVGGVNASVRVRSTSFAQIEMTAINNTALLTIEAGANGDQVLQAGNSSKPLRIFTGSNYYTDFQIDGRVTGVAGTGANDFVVKSQLDLKANLISPTFAGNPKSPTPVAGNNSTNIATTQFVATAISTNTSSKANLAGGNAFEGNQTVIGTLSATGDIQTQGLLRIKNSSGFSAMLSANLLTGNTDFLLPNSPGTLVVNSDLSTYATQAFANAKVQNSLAASSTIAPSTNVVNEALDNKASRVSPNDFLALQSFQVGLQSFGNALVNNGDLEITYSAKGVILRSPDNARWRIKVSNAGILSTTSI